MARKKKAEAAAPVIPMDGYRRPERFRTFELQLGSDKPLRVTVRTSLSFGEKNDIPAAQDVTFRDIFEAIAPHVVEWNLTATDRLTGQVTAVPAPADAGWEVMLMLDELETLWLHDVVKNSHMRRSADEPEREKKDETTPEPTGSP